MQYKYSKKNGALQDAAPQAQRQSASFDMVQSMSNNVSIPPPASRAMVPMMANEHAMTRVGAAAPPEPPAPHDPNRGLDRQRSRGRHTLFFYTVAEGERVLMVEPDGHMQIIEGPARVWRRKRSFQPMAHYVAHPGEFLIIRHRDGRQEHLPGPAHFWLDPRVHLSATLEEAVQIASMEAVVAYAQRGDEVTRRVVHGPATFAPAPAEWLHTFSWHGSLSAEEGYRKIPNSLVFEKLWMLPDQMYHDVVEVRTSDDALLTVKLMIFFELRDIEQMLATTHDPIGDFVNAATSDVVEFLSRHDFESFKANTDKLNDLETYRQLQSRAAQCGYRINKVVYRGYGAPPALQQMHDQAIESRTRLQLERATQQQAQELEDFKQERSLARATKQRAADAHAQGHQLEQQRRQEEAALTLERLRREAARQQEIEDANARAALAAHQNELQRAHLAELARIGVDLTALLTQGRADQVIELRGGEGASPHVHLSSGHTRS